MPESEALLHFEIRDNSKPIELLDLTAAMFAFGEQFKEHAIREYGETPEYRLYIQELKTGSILATLAAYAKQAKLIAETVKPVVSFARELREFYSSFKAGKTEHGKLSRRDLEQRSALLEPVAKDSSARLNIEAKEGGVVNINLVINSLEANAYQNEIQRFLKAEPLPQNGIHQHQLLYLYQGRKDARKETGNYGRIDRFGNKPCKITFAGDEVRNAILGTAVNPFDLVFDVDVDVSTVEERPVRYRILHVHEAFPRDEISS